MWIIEKRKHGNEIWVGTNKEAIFVGEGYDEKEYKRSMELADVIAKALNKHETRAITKKASAESKKN